MAKTSEKLYREASTTKAVSFRTYLTDEQLRAVCEGHDGMIRVMVSAFHDKDTKPNGEAKEPHRHGYILLDRSRELKNVQSWFKATDDDGKDVQTYLEAVLDTVGCDDYLTHNTAEAKADGKFQYTEEVIKVLKGTRDDWRAFKTDWLRKHDARVAKEANADEVEQLLQDIINNVPMREMARRYGRDYIKNVKAYRSYAGAMVFEETGDLTKAFEVERGGDMCAVMEKVRNTEYRAGCADALKSLRVAWLARAKAGENYLNEPVEDINEMLKAFM